MHSLAYFVVVVVGARSLAAGASEAPMPSLADWERFLLEAAKASPLLVTPAASAHASQLGAQAALTLPPWTLNLSGKQHWPARSHALDARGLPERSATSMDLQIHKPFGVGVEVSAGVGYQWTRYHPWTGEQTAPLSSLRGDLSIYADLWRDRFGRFATAQREVGAAVFRAHGERARGDLQSRVAQLFTTALQRCVRLEQHRRNLELMLVLEQLLETVTLRSRAELGRSSDLLQFQNLVLTIKADDQAVSEEAAWLSSTLHTVYGLDAERMGCPGLDLPPEEPRLPTDLRDAPEAVAARLEVEAARFEAQAARWKQSPTLTPFVEAFGASSDEVGQAAARGFGSPSNNWGAATGLILTVPLGDEAAERNATAVVARLATAVARAAEVDSTLRDELARARARLRNSRILHGILAEQESLTKQYLDTERSRYEVGRSNAFTLTAAYQDYWRVLTTKPPVVADWHAARWSAQAAVGTLARLPMP